MDTRYKSKAKLYLIYNIFQIFQIVYEGNAMLWKCPFLTVDVSIWLQLIQSISSIENYLLHS